uniref:Uncharacterized protein n=1 Tax=Chenopodium quinoa TaxID=63459 RepID=A0A803LPY0_CHEQI
MAPPSSNYYTKVQKDANMMMEVYNRRNGPRPGQAPHQFPPRDRNSTMDCFEAAQKYGGVMICEAYHKKQPINKFY